MRLSGFFLLLVGIFSPCFLRYVLRNTKYVCRISVPVDMPEHPTNIELGDSEKRSESTLTLVLIL